ncbi:uncharacterized protein B0T15DRAFT_399348 [Chaetomium strumarium]|uniref:Zn(2)-C6 fungal-type domain-containing protein n=1 Tax=Chaetomium strumarium TaxID=1170767 RepID=A0AAJ0GR00_9PEZI|nr:hypothetical protein B0T15DRAFT_399348 [Chaetomium strumarium]
MDTGSQDATEFDYSAFLQDQQEDIDIDDYLAEESSASASTATLTEGSVPQSESPASQHRTPQRRLLPSGPLTTTRSQQHESWPPAAQPKQRLERRGHTKSRRGCFNCKRRRIKCQETRPACGHCVKQGLKCEYPPQHQVPLFSLQDMRFFQHFLLNCYPHHPIGSEDLWTHEIPCLSQRYEYLMHAILGYSASDLISTSEPGLAEAAMAHRVKAIRAIKRALGNNAAAEQPGTDMFEEGNALMATCFALTFQSVFLDDGMAEYMTFIRGIIIVAIQMYVKGAKLLFGHLLGGDTQKEKLEPHMSRIPLIEKVWTDRAVEGIEGLEGLVEGEGREVERRFWELLREMARMLYVSSWKAYEGLMEHYSWWMMLPHDQYQRLIDPNNQVSILLGAHWVALEQIMAVITEAERKAAAKTPNQSPGAGISLGTIRWLKYLNTQVDAHHHAYNSFPRWVEAQLDRDRGYFGRSR